MIARRLIRAALAGLLATATMPLARAGAPAFVPTSGALYDGFDALGEPRSVLPVGALWIDGYGPTGEAAAADNLETVKSLSTVNVERSLQIGITAGLLRLFGIDPSLKSHLSAHLSDISIVRVKDLAKLAGPPAQPRIYEALKAGRITITTDSGQGLNLSNGPTQRDLIGRLDANHTRSLTIEGTDLFIAFHVATLRSTTAKAVHVRLRRGADQKWTGELGKFAVTVDTTDVDRCLAAASDAAVAGACRLHAGALTIAAMDGGTTPALGSAAAQIGFAEAVEPVSVVLPVPIADDDGGLASKARAGGEVEFRQAGRSVSGYVLSELRLSVAYESLRIDTLDKPRAKGW